jgi:hypothetical protein
MSTPPSSGPQVAEELRSDPDLPYFYLLRRRRGQHEAGLEE